MRLKTPFLGLLGLLAVGLVAMQLVQGALTVTEAAVRIAVVAAALTVVERLVLPLARTLVSTGTPKDP
jgi:hypothetical protein